MPGKIVVGGIGKEDFRTWNWTKNGLFSVRSAHHLGMSLKSTKPTQACSSSAVVDLKRWLGLWSTDVANKVKNSCMAFTQERASSGSGVASEAHQTRNLLRGVWERRNSHSSILEVPALSVFLEIVV